MRGTPSKTIRELVRMMLLKMTNMPLLRAMVLKDMDSLVHDKENGFYDAELDWFFEDLNQWAHHKYGISLSEIDA
jgi:hypothetical protein